MRYSAEFISRLLEIRPQASVLVIALEAPEWIYTHRGPVLLIVETSLSRVLESEKHFFRKVKGAREVEMFLREIGGYGFSPFDFIYIDHRHDLATVVNQVNLTLPLSGPNSIFAFDDAVPPTIAMAGPRPTQDWYVGEVWMLAHILAPSGSGFFATTLDLAPTGLLVAAQFVSIDHDVYISAYERLSGVTTDDELRQINKHGEIVQSLQRCLLTSLGPCIQVVPGEASKCDFSEVAIDNEVEWERPSPVLLLDLSGSERDLSFLQSRRCRLHSKTVATFEDCHLFGNDLVLYKNLVFDRKIEQGDDRFRTLGDHFGTYENKNSGVQNIFGSCIVAQERFARAIELGGDIVLGTPDERDNYGMWLFFGLPSVRLFQADPNRRKLYLSHAGMNWQVNLLRSFGLAMDRLILQDTREVYKARQLSMIRHSRRDLAVSASDAAIFEETADEYRNCATGFERIFVSRLGRTQSGAYRGLQEEVELISKLSEIGFQTVQPEQLSFSEQVSVFRSAKVVVGLGGAAMFNCVFCRPGTLVITIESSTRYLDSHVNLFASKGLEYGVILGSELINDPTPVQKRWTLDVGKAVAAIRGAVE